MLGIVSGAGTFAGSFFYQKLIQTYQGHVKQDNDFPHILLNNYPFSSLDKTGIDNKDKLKQELIMAITPLIHCQKIIIICNSVYTEIESVIEHFNTVFSLSLKEKLIFLPEITITAFNKEQTKNNTHPLKALVLCSQSSKKQDLFHIKGRKDSVYPKKKLMLLTEHIIDMVIKGVNHKKIKKEFYHSPCVKPPAEARGFTQYNKLK